MTWHFMWLRPRLKNHLEAPDLPSLGINPGRNAPVIKSNDTGLLASRVEGRERQYLLRPEPLQEIAAWIAQIEAQWDAKLEALHHHLMRTAEATTDGDAEPEHSS
jgi:hypothetical protein